MAADLTLIDDAHNAVELIELGEIHLSDSGEGFLEGEPRRYGIKNTGTTNMRHVEIGLAGDGAERVQIAPDIDGEPGQFTDADTFLELSGEATLFRDETVYFWLRPAYTPEDAEGRKLFRVVLNAESF